MNYSLQKSKRSKERFFVYFSFSNQLEKWKSTCRMEHWQQTKLTEKKNEANKQTKKKRRETYRDDDDSFMLFLATKVCVGLLSIRNF